MSHTYIIFNLTALRLLHQAKESLHLQVVWADNEPRSVELEYFFLLASAASSVTNDIKDIYKYVYMSRSSIQLIYSLRRMWSNLCACTLNRQ